MSQTPDTNPYASPSDASIPAAFQVEPRFRLWAVFVGWLVDVVVSSIGGALIGILVGAALVAQGADFEKCKKLSRLLLLC